MKTLVVIAAASALALPAFAADLPSTAAPAAPAAPVAPSSFDWTGLYIGPQLGYSWNTDATRDTDANTGAFNGVGSGINAGDKFFGGGQIGYDYMFASHLVLGVEADLLLKRGSSATNANATNTLSVTNRTSGNFSGVLDARLGYAIGDFMPYLIGGWAWTTSDNTRTQNIGIVGLAGPGTVEKASVARNGWNVGGGLAYRFLGNWTVFGQYAYTKYAATTISFPIAQRAYKSKLDNNALSLGLNYKF